MAENPIGGLAWPASWRIAVPVSISRSAPTRKAELQGDQGSVKPSVPGGPTFSFTDSFESSGSTAALASTLAAESLYAGNVKLNGSLAPTEPPESSGLTLVDESRGGSKVVDAKGSPVTLTREVLEGRGTSAERMAVDAHFALQATWDFLQEVLGRNSYDDRGSPLVAELGNKPQAQAEWNNGRAVLYPGDGKFGPYATLDIVGHEIGHGILKSHGAFRAGHSGEGPALGEAYADIFGTGVEWYASRKWDAVEFDWLLGEDAGRLYRDNHGRDFVRDMAKPTTREHHLDHYSNYRNQFPHYASGIATNAFWLAANGGTNETSGRSVEEGIGIEAALKIFHGSLKHIEDNSGFNAGFSCARIATMQAAEELYGRGSPEQRAVAAGWEAVGIPPAEEDALLKFYGGGPRASWWREPEDGWDPGEIDNPLPGDIDDPTPNPVDRVISVGFPSEFGDIIQLEDHRPRTIEVYLDGETREVNLRKRGSRLEVTLTEWGDFYSIDLEKQRGDVVSLDVLLPHVFG